MGAPLELAGALKRTEKGNADWYYGGGDVAWASITAALAGVPTAVRLGKTVGVLINSKVVEYIWHTDVTDSGLTKKTADVDLSNYYNKSQVDISLGNKVDKSGTKQLSDENYTTGDKNKVAILYNIDTQPTANSLNLVNSGGVKQAIIDAVTGLYDDRGNYDPTGTSAYPTSSNNGSGASGAILKGDIWTISADGTIAGFGQVKKGYTVRALNDSPGQTAANWDILQVGIGYVPENAANKDQNGGYVGKTASGNINATADQLPESTSNPINLYFTTARVLATLLTGLAVTGAAAIAATDSVIVALGKLQAQISNRLTGTAATDAETQISAAVTEDNKFVSRSKLFNWFAWRLSQSVVFQAAVQFVALAGLNNKMLMVDPSGNVLGGPIVDTGGFISDTDIITEITNAINNSLFAKSNNYQITINPANSKTFNQGKWYNGGKYKYYAVGDNTVWLVNPDF